MKSSGLLHNTKQKQRIFHLCVMGANKGERSVRLQINRLILFFSFQGNVSIYMTFFRPDSDSLTACRPFFSVPRSEIFLSCTCTEYFCLNVRTLGLSYCVMGGDTMSCLYSAGNMYLQQKAHGAFSKSLPMKCYCYSKLFDKNVSILLLDVILA